MNQTIHITSTTNSIIGPNKDEYGEKYGSITGK